MILRKNIFARLENIGRDGSPSRPPACMATIRLTRRSSPTPRLISQASILIPEVLAWER